MHKRQIQFGWSVGLGLAMAGGGLALVDGAGWGLLYAGLLVAGLTLVAQRRPLPSVVPARIQRQPHGE